MYADVLMIGVAASFYDHFQRSVKDGLLGRHMGWNYVANPVRSFDYAVTFIGKRPELDLVYITNHVKLGEDEICEGAVKLADALAIHPYKPWVVLNIDIRFAAAIFASRGINVEHVNIEDALEVRHSMKCDIARSNAA
jgi:hypothetical protein